MPAPTWLSNIGNALKKIFSPGAIKVEAQIADILLPGFAPLINSAASAIIGAETAAAAIIFGPIRTDHTVPRLCAG